MKFILLFLILLFTTQNAQCQNNNYCHLKILTWNIQMLPKMSMKCKSQSKRSKAIIETLKNQDYDIIVFQEVFNEEIFRKMYRGLKNEYPYHTGMPMKRNF